MKVDQQFKERFFAQYYGQEVVNHRKINGRSIIKIDHKYFFLNKSIKNDFLELTPLSAITDEHVIEVLKILGVQNKISVPNRDRNWICNSFLKNEWSHKTVSVIEATDLLRSKGYALPFGGKSVKQLIEKGYLKLSRIDVK